MEKQFRDLQLQQMDALLQTWRVAEFSARPSAGWVRAIRDSLGMSAVAFAKRLGMTPVGVRKLESAEASDAITLASLRKLAQALDCELQYALVPRTPLVKQVRDRAERLHMSACVQLLIPWRLRTKPFRGRRTNFSLSWPSRI